MNKASKLFTKIFFLTLVLGLSASIGLFAVTGKDYQTIEGRHRPIWKLEASNPLLIGGYGDNFDWSGSKTAPLMGNAVVNINARRDIGEMVVTLKGTINPEKGKTFSGDIKIIYRAFSEGPAFWEGGIADFVWLHGDTKQGPPVMPKVRTYLASWGPADVWVNDELVYEGLDGHMMYTERSRDKETFAIYNRDKSGFYSPKDPANFSIADPDEREIHFVAHTNDEDSGNFPPNKVWIHLNFVDVAEVK
jgi:hypothetical protein